MHSVIQTLKIGFKFIVKLNLIIFIYYQVLRN